VTRTRRHRGSRGAAIVELAIVAPFLLLMLFGIGEMGLAWVSGNRLEGAVSTAARTGASSGSVVDADRNILLSLRASLPQKLLDNVERVVVYSSNPSGGIAAACRTATPGTGVGDGSAASGANRCNTYSGSTLRSVTATTNLGSSDDFWRSTNRRDRLSGPPDYIGVLVETRHDAVTGTFWSGFDLERSSVYRIQPDIDG
jgi:Flp pilus assembly protein TadG